MGKKGKEKNECAAVAGQRSYIYGFLATVYCQELTLDLLKQMKDSQFLEVFTNLGVDLGHEFSQKPEEEILEELAVEYARLFLGPGRHISPHESVHHQREDGQWGQLWGKSTVDVKKFIEAAGFHYEAEYKGIPDHVSVELEFMQHVSEREGQAWEVNDKDSALYCRNIQKRFIEEHLAKWIPQFCDKVTQKAEFPFYRDMAALTKHFIEFEREAMIQYGEGVGRRCSGEMVR